MIKDLIVTQLDIIKVYGGDVMHAMKQSDEGFCGFGEVYFSKIGCNSIKAWKRHRQMTLNLIVPLGKVRFVVFDDRDSSTAKFHEIVISKDNYCRLTIPPMVWVGFQGLSNGESILLNVANMEHDASECDRVSLEKIEFNWEQ